VVLEVVGLVSSGTTDVLSRLLADERRPILHLGRAYSLRSVPLVIVVLAFIVMEPITYLTHRYVMHGFGAFLHRSHHRRNSTGWEANDLYPVLFGSGVCIALAIGFNVAGFSAVIPVGIGITLYGITYALVHDVYIHGRLQFFRKPVARLDVLAERHELHHRFNGEPYGMLLPIVPKALLQRAAKGSSPSHEPVDA
jgi:beta-carotene 3-hydroxylase